MQVTVSYNKLHIAPRKLRAVISDLRKKAVPEAIALMVASNRMTNEPIRKLLLSSISAAHDKNPALRPEQLSVEEIYCNEGARQYRTRRKSRGRSAKYAKRGSHLTLVVSWSDTATPVVEKKRAKTAIKKQEVSSQKQVTKGPDNSQLATDNSPKTIKTAADKQGGAPAADAKDYREAK